MNTPLLQEYFARDPECAERRVVDWLYGLTFLIWRVRWGRDGWRAAELIEGRSELAESGAQFGRVGSEADAEVGVGQFEFRAGMTRVLRSSAMLR